MKLKDLICSRPQGRRQVSNKPGAGMDLFVLLSLMWGKGVSL